MHRLPVWTSAPVAPAASSERGQLRRRLAVAQEILEREWAELEKYCASAAAHLRETEAPIQHYVGSRDEERYSIFVDGWNVAGEVYLTRQGFLGVLAGPESSRKNNPKLNLEEWLTYRKVRRLSKPKLNRLFTVDGVAEPAAG